MAADAVAGALVVENAAGPSALTVSGGSINLVAGTTLSFTKSTASANAGAVSLTAPAAAR